MRMGGQLRRMETATRARIMDRSGTRGTVRRVVPLAGRIGRVAEPSPVLELLVDVAPAVELNQASEFEIEHLRGTSDGDRSDRVLFPNHTSQRCQFLSGTWS